MRFKNTSRYDSAEIRRLVELGVKGVSMDRVAVHVKNCRDWPFRGRAYRGVPAMSSARAEYLITIGIGAPERFPADNMVRTVRWIELGADDPHPGKDHPWKKTCRGGTERHFYGETIFHPYGGKRSPLIEYLDWQEAVVAVAAHEARHLHQYRTQRPLSEVDAERAALKALQRYRAAAT